MTNPLTGRARRRRSGGRLGVVEPASIL